MKPEITPNLAINLICNEWNIPAKCVKWCGEAEANRYKIYYLQKLDYCFCDVWICTNTRLRGSDWHLFREIVANPTRPPIYYQTTPGIDGQLVHLFVMGVAQAHQYPSTVTLSDLIHQQINRMAETAHASLSVDGEVVWTLNQRENGLDWEHINESLQGDEE